MINVDTDALTALAKNMQAANEQITEAVQLLNRTTTHSDWGCRERVRIGEILTNNKKTIQILQERSEAFARAVTYAANEFVAVERDIAEVIGQNDAEISHIISIPSPVKVIGGIGGNLNQIQKILNEIGLSDVAKHPEDTIRPIVKGMLSIARGAGIAEPIPICRFSDILIGKGGK